MPLMDQVVLVVISLGKIIVFSQRIEAKQPFKTYFVA
jgi:hypothetical protein